MAKHYNRKFVKDIIGTLEKNGFDCVQHSNNKNKYDISKNGGYVVRAVHSGMSCFHALRRDLKEYYNFNINEN